MTAERAWGAPKRFGLLCGAPKAEVVEPKGVAGAEAVPKALGAVEPKAGVDPNIPPLSAVQVPGT